MARCLEHGFDGLEANLHHRVFAGREPAGLEADLQDAGLSLILELVTGGDYVPALHCQPADHLRELATMLERARLCRPLKVTVITGSDAWPWAVQEPFWREVLALAGDSGWR